MTKKDYELVSDAINSVFSRRGKYDEATIHAVIDELCGALKYDNARFDQGRFIVACLR